MPDIRAPDKQTGIGAAFRKSAYTPRYMADLAIWRELENRA